jgi:hypothetical protein
MAAENCRTVPLHIEKRKSIAVKLRIKMRFVAL